MSRAMSETLFDRYRKLRDQGCSPWVAANELMMRDKQRSRMEADYRAARASQKAEPPPRLPPLVKPILDYGEPHDLGDEDHVKAIIRAGGFPTAVIGRGWLYGGKPWRLSE